MLFGAIGMCATDAILAGVLSDAATNGGNGGAGSVVGAVMLYVHAPSLSRILTCTASCLIPSSVSDGLA